MPDPFAEPTGRVNLYRHGNGGGQVDITYRLADGNEFFGPAAIVELDESFAGVSCGHATLYAGSPEELERLIAVLQEAADDLRRAQAGKVTNAVPVVT